MEDRALNDEPKGRGRLSKRPKSATPDHPEPPEIEGPYGNMLMDDAWRKGRAARTAGKGRECPFGNYPSRAAIRAWFEGWDSIGPTIVHVEPPIQSRPLTVATPGQFWPKEKPLPTHYIRPEPLPCRSCHAVVLPTLVQAVITRATRDSVAYLYCRACGATFPMPIAAGPPTPAPEVSD